LGPVPVAPDRTGRIAICRADRRRTPAQVQVRHLRSPSVTPLLFGHGPDTGPHAINTLPSFAWCRDHGVDGI
jgi:hypothetical protein